MLLGTLLSASIVALSGLASAAPGGHGGHGGPGGHGGHGGSWNKTIPCSDHGRHNCNLPPLKKPDCNKYQPYCAISAKDYSKYGA